MVVWRRSDSEPTRDRYLAAFSFAIRSRPDPASLGLQTPSCVRRSFATFELLQVEFFECRHGLIFPSLMPLEPILVIRLIPGLKDLKERN